MIFSLPILNKKLTSKILLTLSEIIVLVSLTDPLHNFFERKNGMANYFFLLIFQPFIGSHYRVYIRVKRHSKMSFMLNVKTTKFLDFSHITCILHACTNDVSNTLAEYWTKSVESTKQSIKSSIEFVYRIVLLLINFWQLFPLVSSRRGWRVILPSFSLGTNFVWWRATRNHSSQFSLTVIFHCEYLLLLPPRVIQWFCMKKVTLSHCSLPTTIAIFF